MASSKFSDEWTSLARINFTFAEQVAKNFRNAGTFIVSLEDEKDADSVVQLVMGGLLSSAETTILGKQVWDWRQASLRTEGRILRSLQCNVESGPYIRRGIKPDPCDTYSNLVSQNPEVGLAVLDKHLKQLKQCRSGTSRQLVEDLRKDRWTLKLVGFLKDAQLPSVQQIEALAGPSSAWKKAFGSRRGGTLKNRALAWEAFARWLEQYEGTAWPKSAATVLQYF